MVQERESIRPLVDRGLIARPRVLQLERTGSGLEGQIGETTSNIAKARQAIAEKMQQDLQLDNDRMTEVTRDLRDTQAKIVEVIPQADECHGGPRPHGNSLALRRARWLALNIFSVGGVIARGEKIMDVVPDRDSLVVEAQIAVDDISDLQPKMRADVHLTAYKQRIIPIVQGDVIHVSADRLTDQRTGNPYYTALVRLNAEDLAAAPGYSTLSRDAGNRDDPDGRAHGARLHRRPAGAVVQSRLPAALIRPSVRRQVLRRSRKLRREIAHLRAERSQRGDATGIRSNEAGAQDSRSGGMADAVSA